MSSILSPQQICELDTFTLEEKIEELESDPNRQIYSELLKTAKLELIDRLQIQEFGRKLANDEYKIQQQVRIPKLNQFCPKIITPHNAPVQARKQIISKMQENFVSVGSFLKVGKPSINHHFKPKQKKIEIIQPTKHFLRAKKHDFSKAKTKRIMDKQPIIKRTEYNPVKKQQSIKPLQKIIDSRQQKSAQKQIPKQFSLKQKLKKEIQALQVVFIENDAYDDMKQIKLIPQNLIEQEIKMKEEEVQRIDTEIQEQKLTHEPNIGEFNLQDIIDKAEDVQTLNCINQMKTEIIQDISIDNIELPNQSCKDTSVTNHQIVQQKLNANTKSKVFCPAATEIINLDINLDNIEVNQKQNKSKSVRSLHNNKPSIKKFEIDDRYQFNVQSQQIAKLINQKNASTRVLKQEPKVKQSAIRMNSTNYGNFRQSFVKQEVFPYHQTISSFQRLFPHNKNLLITLRNVEQSLKLHFSKNIKQKCQSSQYLRLNEQDITFRVISQSQKAKKYSNYFNIGVQSFHRRGEIMLKRVNRQLPDNEDILLYRVVRTKEQVYDIINCSFHRTSNWYELPHGMELKANWNLLWTWSKPQIDFTDLVYFQRVNHFIGNKQIARKDLLKKNIENIQKLGPKMKHLFDIIPETYLLPGENISFIKKFREVGMKDHSNFWILKPVGLSRGRGISLINKLEDVVFSQPVVLQRYLSNPLLVDGYKFDMRIYVLVTSINPLEAFIYKEGFARLSTEKYSMDQTDMQNKFIHLTNFSINKENISDRKLTQQQQLGGCKISLRMLSERLEKAGISWREIERQIKQIVLKSLISCMNVIPVNPNCFELFGYDIIIDTDLKCWLLEVNSSPSLQKEYTLDEIIKQQLVDDIIQILNPINYDRQRLLEVVQRRRKEAEGLKSAITTSNHSVWQLNQDINYILHGQKIRKYGECAQHENFQVIAPSDKYYSIVKALQQYKIDPIIKDS